MKWFLHPADAAGNVDPTIQHGLLDLLPGRVDSELQSDCVIVPISWMSNYRFDGTLLAVQKPWILVEFIEFGWSAGDKLNILGTGELSQFGHLSSEEWQKFDDWVRDHPPALTFKRELFTRDVSDRMLPIEWPCRIPAPPLQSKEEFENRPFEVFSSWGLSHPARPRLHGDIFRNAHDCGIHVIDAWEQGGHFEKRNWATIHVPHYQRKPISDVMQWNQWANLSISLPGAGVKCFRHSEAPVGSIMALIEDNLAWAFPWVNGENCIRLRVGHEFTDLLDAFTINPEFIYEIYVASQETIDRYRSQRYAIEYVMPNISRHL